MTTPDDARIDRSLADLTESLDAMIDVDAGLRDARLPDRGRSLDESVREVLDVDAGLQAILSRPDSATPTRTPSTEPIREFTQDLARRSPHERLRLRSGLPLTELRLLRQFVVAQRDSYALVVHLDGLTRSVDHRAVDLARLVASELEGTEHHGFAVRLADQCGPPLDNAIGLHDAQTNARTLNRNISRSHDDAVSAIRDRNRPLGLAISRTYGSDALIAGIAGVIEAATDFTGADLSGLDPGGVDLVGVRWSIVTTRWPADWERVIRDRSVPIDADVYEIRDDPHIRNTVT